jgi:catechol 2,3-dioxygenase-like lactoylglutathione lyase family enzyme
MDMKLELIAVPVSDVDRAKAFYSEQAGFNLDHDHTLSEDVRFVQLTPPDHRRGARSGCADHAGRR